MNKGLKAWSANFGRAHAETNFVTGEAGQQESGESNPTNQAAELKRFASEFLELLQGSGGRNETALEAVLDLEGSYAVALAELTDERESGMADMQVCCTQTLDQFLLLNVTLLQMLMLLLMLITLLLLMLSLLPIVTLVVVPLPLLLMLSLLLLLLLRLLLLSLLLIRSRVGRIGNLWRWRTCACRLPCRLQPQWKTGWSRSASP